MALTRLKPVALCGGLLLGAVAVLTVPANALQVWYIVESGGGGSCGPFCTRVIPDRITIWIVPDNAFDPGRFPDRDPNGMGRGGGGGGRPAPQKTPDNKVKWIGKDGKERRCTIPPTYDKVRGLPKGVKEWPVYIGPMDPVNDAAYRAVLAEINGGQYARGRPVQLVLVSEPEAARLVIRYATPTDIYPIRDPRQLGQAYRNLSRNGTLRGSVITVPPTPPGSKPWTDPVIITQVKSTAAHEVGHALGVTHTAAPDAAAPSVMDDPIPFGQTLDPCTEAAIDAALNPDPVR